ncbi:hypothetical protein BJX70DRAFT_398139 [Aspergillus crustosus]
MPSSFLINQWSRLKLLDVAQCGGKEHKDGCESIRTFKRQNLERRSEISRLPPVASSTITKVKPPTRAQTTTTELSQLLPQETPSVSPDNQPVAPNIRVPMFAHSIKRLAKYLCRPVDPLLNQMQYAAVIQNYGGPTSVAQILVSAIEPDLLALEGTEVRREHLDQIRATQSQEQDKTPWMPYSGYMDYVTDSRDLKYWRVYIGQSKNPPSRISQHIRNIINGHDDTLHYYVILQGKGYRSANFIRLWTLVCPDYVPSSVQDIFANILEMVMCRAFESLPKGVLEEYFGHLSDKSSNLGLNIIPPIFQSLRLAPMHRKQFKMGLETSGDQNIAGWPEYQRKQGAKHASNYSLNRPHMTLADHKVELNKVMQALGLNGVKPFDADLEVALADFDLEQWFDELQNHLQDEMLLAPVEIRRIYLESPAPLTELLANNWRVAQKISDLFAFAASMSHTPAIYTYFSDGAGALTLIIRVYEDEKKGQLRVTADTIHPAIRSWLARKGFTGDEDVKRLEKHGTSLSNALLLLCSILPRIPLEFNAEGRRERVAPSRMRGSGRGSAIENGIGDADGIDMATLVDDDLDLKLLNQDLKLSSRADLERTTAPTDGKGRYALNNTDPVISTVQPDQISRDHRHATKLGRTVLATQMSLVAGTYFLGDKGTLCGKMGRLGFHVTNTQGQVDYPSTDTWINVFKANSCVDWMSGDTVHQLALRPRRFIWICPETSAFPPGIDEAGS